MLCFTSIMKPTKISNLDFRRFFILEQDLYMSKDEYRKATIDAVKKLSEDVGIPKTLRKIGVKEEDLQLLAESAMEDACTPGNSRDTSIEEIFEIYK